jgi:hypothetical protein
MLLMFVGQISFAQLYINGDLTIQNGATVYAQDTVWVDALASVNVAGTLHTTKDVVRLGSFINTSAGGYLIAPVHAGVTKTFPLGTTTNNSIMLSHQSGNLVFYKMSVRDNVYQNPSIQTTLQTSNVVDKTWHIQALSTAPATQFKAGWNNSNELSGFTRGNCTVSNWKQGVSVAWNPSTYAAAALNGTQPQYFATAATANLDSGVWYYYGVGSGSALPVQFIGIQARVVSSTQNTISWQVAQLSNSSHFEIEHLSTTNQWEFIGKVASVKVSQIKQNYTFNHLANNLQGTNYYRVKQVDLNGGFTYSKTASVQQQSSAKFIVYPNPSNGIVYVNNHQLEVATVVIYNAMGAEVYSNNQYTNNSAINLKHLNQGVYILQHQSLTGKQTQRIIIQ